MCGCNLTQAGKNLGCSHGLGFPCIETRDPFRYFIIPSGVCAGFGIRLNADKEPVSEGNPLIGREHESIVRQGLPQQWRHFDLERRADYDVISRDPDVFLRLHPRQTAMDEAQVLPELFPAPRLYDERLIGLPFTQL